MAVSGGSHELAAGRTLLEWEVLGLHQSTQPDHFVLTQRANLVKSLQVIIHNRYGPRFTIEPFGSTLYGVSRPTSDLDLTVRDLDRPDGFSPEVDGARLPPIYDPNHLARTLVANGFRSVSPIHASVPIVKLTDHCTPLQCDINVNDQFGLHNSRLLRAYFDLVTNARPLATALKHWAKCRGLNDPSGSSGPTTLSSYSIVLLLLSYLQVKGHLPNLQDPALIEQTGVAPTFLWARPAKQKSAGKKSKASKRHQGALVGAPVDVQQAPLHVRCETTFVPAYAAFRAQVSELAPLTLDAGLRGFFAYYAAFDFENTVVALAASGTMPRAVSFKMVATKAEADTVKRRSEEGTAVQPDAVDDMAEVVSRLGDIHVRGQTESPVIQRLTGDLNSAETAALELEEDAEDAHRIADGVNFLQPATWQEHLIITQDPFIQARNTSGSIQAVTARYIISEFRRAHKLLTIGAAFAELCAPPEKPVAGVRPRRANTILSPVSAPPLQPNADLMSMLARARQSNLNISTPLNKAQQFKTHQEKQLKAAGPEADGQSAAKGPSTSGAMLNPSAAHFVPSHMPSRIPVIIRAEPTSEDALLLRRQCHMTGVTRLTDFALRVALGERFGPVLLVVRETHGADRVLVTFASEEGALIAVASSVRGDVPGGGILLNSWVAGLVHVFVEAPESRGTSQAPSPARAADTPPRSPQGWPGGPTVFGGGGLSTPDANRRPPLDKEQSPMYQAVMALTTPQCFAKGVIEGVSNQQFVQVLTHRFGPVKELEVVRSKACAFLEFNTLEAAKRAIVASLPLHAGGEGGIRIDIGDGAVARVSVETRKERGKRPVRRPRGTEELQQHVRLR